MGSATHPLYVSVASVASKGMGKEGGGGLSGNHGWRNQEGDGRQGNCCNKVNTRPTTAVGGRTCLTAVYAAAASKVL